MKNEQIGIRTHSFYETGEKSPIRPHYGFYETDKQLGIEPRTQEELEEYKRLFGMPLTEDYEELMESLVTPNTTGSKTSRLNCTRIQFSDYDFIKLFIAFIREKGQMFIDRNMLRYQLYEFYNMEEYHQLFQDFAIKQQIEGNFIDMEESLQNAVLYGLINSHDIQPTNNNRLILIDNEYCKRILSSYSEEYVSKMDNLTDIYLKNFSSNKVKSKTL